jgi:hypothetical protein
MKKKFPHVINSIALATSFVFLLAAQTVSAQIEWRNVTPVEMQMKTPQVEPDADAEAIFWEVRLDDKKSNKLSYEHYVRVKIFTERGRERFSKFDIPYTKNKKVEDVSARVIKPDGTIVALNPQDIFEREIVRAGKIKINAVSFAVPGIEPGVIVEYQYREVFKNDSAGGERLIFQRDIPIQRISYAVRPYQGSNLKYKPYNMPDVRFTEDLSNKGFYIATMNNVPAFKEEPYMPPDDEVRRWMYLYYSGWNSFNWRLFGVGASQFFIEATKPKKEVMAKAAELTSLAANEDEKLRRLYDFTQKQIRNISFDSTFTDEQRENLKLKTPEDVLKRGVGDIGFIDLLFASLARAAGFETNLVMTGDRSELFFSPEKYVGSSFINPAGVAVRVGSEWKFFSPGKPYLPYGRMPWANEDVSALMIGSEGSVWNKMPLSKPEQSRAKRTGKFNLLEDGTLEGTVRIEFEGHQAISRRRAEFNDSPAKREENVKNDLKGRISVAEVSAITVENFSDPAKPLTYVYKVRVPNYAQKTGKRLFLQPGFFEYGAKPVFSSATRTHSVYFPYPWSEDDEVEIQLPKGFEMENGDAPVSISDRGKVGFLQISIGVDKTANLLQLKRNFYFGGNNTVLFAPSLYQPLKSLFDAFHKADSHTLTLRQSGN